MNRSTQHAFEPEEVMAYLDGELEPQRAAALADHLERCEECHALAAQLRQVSERLLDFQLEPFPAGIGEAVLSALECRDSASKSTPGDPGGKKPRRWRLKLMSPYTWAFACVVIAILVANNWYAIRDRFGPARPVTKAEMVETAVSPYLYKLSPSAARAGGGGDAGVAADTLEAPNAKGPMIAQTASLTIVATNYDEASAEIDRLATAHGGYVQKLAAEARTGASRELSVTLRVPAAQLDGFLVDARKLGHVEKETRANDEVTDQYVDLQARLKSARATEQRMLQLLATRTGKLEDVLAAEQELARIREEIEGMEGQRVLLARRVSYATVDVQLQEEYREQLNSRSSSKGTEIWNATVEGFHNLEDGVVAALIFALAYGPSTVLWLAIVLVPAWFIWRRVRSNKGRPSLD